MYGGEGENLFVDVGGVEGQSHRTMHASVDTIVIISIIKQDPFRHMAKVRLVHGPFRCQQ